MVFRCDHLQNGLLALLFALDQGENFRIGLFELMNGFINFVSYFCHYSYLQF